MLNLLDLEGRVGQSDHVFGFFIYFMISIGSVWKCILILILIDRETCVVLLIISFSILLDSFLYNI